MLLSPLVYSNNFIKRSLDTGIPLTPMKLQKLPYLLYARFYAMYNRPLFATQFEKWPRGPVLSEVYNAFKKYGANTIGEFSRDLNGRIAAADESHPEFGPCFDLVWCKYGRFDGITLSQLTHQENTAWSKTDAMGDILKLEDVIEDGKRFFE